MSQLAKTFDFIVKEPNFSKYFMNFDRDVYIVDHAIHGGIQLLGEEADALRQRFKHDNTYFSKVMRKVFQHKNLTVPDHYEVIFSPRMSEDGYFPVLENF